jgi:hypothetical protein
MKFFLNFIKIYQLVQKLLERDRDRQHDDFINHSFLFNESKLKTHNVYESIVEKTYSGTRNMLQFVMHFFF